MVAEGHGASPGCLVSEEKDERPESMSCVSWDTSQVVGTLSPVGRAVFMRLCPQQLPSPIILRCSDDAEFKDALQAPVFSMGSQVRWLEQAEPLSLACCRLLF